MDIEATAQRISQWTSYAKKESIDDSTGAMIPLPSNVGTSMECFIVNAREINEARDLMREMLAEIKRLGGAS